MNSMTPVERVARAIYERSCADTDYDNLPWAQLLPTVTDAYLGLARAAIAAMREPSPEMVEDGEDADLLAENVRQIWHAMIDAMLSEGDKP